MSKRRQLTRMALTVSDICMLFARKGGRLYDGEPVTQLEHALQSAARAEAAGASPALVTAALLHDLGHMLNDQGETPTLRGVDDLHQYAALPFLRGTFGDECSSRSSCTSTRSATCARPVRLLRRAVGRFEAQPGCRAASSATAEAAAFIAQPYAADAVQRAAVGRPRQSRRRADAAARPLRHHPRSRAAAAA